MEWMIWLCLALVAIAIVFFYQSYRRHKATQNLVGARISIANDLHDEIGAALSSISFFSEACRLQVANGKIDEAQVLINKIGLHARTTAQSMNDIIWMVHPKNDETGKLVERLTAFGNEIFSVINTRFDIQADERLETLVLPLECRKNVFMICKEALHNIAKYAKATEASLVLRASKQGIDVLIQDNGVGFDTTAEQSGNGLLSMKVRAGAIGASLKVTSQNGKGTSILLQVPVSPKMVI